MSEWKLVPEEPTGDGKPFTLKHNMQRQGAARMWEVTDRQVAGLDMAAEIYRAMLAAAPKPPAGLYEVREDGSVRRVEVDVVKMLQSIITRAYSGRNDFDNFSGWKLGLILEEAKAAQVALTGGNRCEVCRQPVLTVRRCSECADCRALTGEER